MAYVLGYFCADGSMFVNPRGGHFTAFYSNDRQLLEFVRTVLAAEHKISKKKKNDRRKHTSYFLQFGSKKMYYDLIRLGLVPRKSQRLILPPVPSVYFAAFVRGYFDGDGNIVYGFYRRSNRAKPARILAVRFTCGSKYFLEAFAKRIHKEIGISGSFFFQSRAWRLGYSNRPAYKLLNYMYGDHRDNFPILPRKYNKFLEAKKVLVNL